MASLQPRSTAIALVLVALSSSGARAQAPRTETEAAGRFIEDGHACEAYWQLGPSRGGAVTQRELARRHCLAESPNVSLIAGGTWRRDLVEGERTVRISDFQVDRFEVRVRFFARCVELGACETDRFVDHAAENGCNYGAAERGDHPMNCIDWQGAKAYCDWVGGRLPSEAQYEWLASVDGDSRYPWGWAAPTCDYANFRSAGRAGCGFGGTRAVGSHPFGRSPHGVDDLVGNVAEWSIDGFVPELPAGVFTDPFVAGHASRHAVRGGSWRDGPALLGSRSRVGVQATARHEDVGFRCAYDGEATPSPLPPGHPLPYEGSSVAVPVGGFWRGSERGVGDADEHPQRLVTLSTFRIARLEVSVYGYRRCVLAGGCRSLSFRIHSRDPACNYGRDSAGQHPMNCVSWHGAQEFCHWAGGRLPTEAEWEMAARGVDRRTYPWGEAPAECTHANQNPNGLSDSPGCGTGGTLPVGTFYDGVSPFDLFDMAGNVQEWVADWYDAHYYSRAPSSDPPGPLTGSSRVVRGGSYNDGPTYLRSAYRHLLEPSTTPATVGFRCAWPSH